MSDKQDDTRKEGHTREWQDRARVILDAKKDAQKDSADKQSPMTGEGGEKNDSGENDEPEAEKEDPVY